MIIKQITYKCNICGKEFFSEYGEGGYIDHYFNFVGNDTVICQNEPNGIIDEICCSGNEIRNMTDIQERLKCFNLWNCVDGDTKKVVSSKVESIIKMYSDSSKKMSELYRGLNLVDRITISKIADEECSASEWVHIVLNGEEECEVSAND